MCRDSRRWRKIFIMEFFLQDFYDEIFCAGLKEEKCFLCELICVVIVL